MVLEGRTRFEGSVIRRKIFGLREPSVKQPTYWSRRMFPKLTFQEMDFFFIYTLYLSIIDPEQSAQILDTAHDFLQS